MGTADYILTVLLAALLAGAVRSCIRRKKKGGCCGDCSNCRNCR